jgi:hypothetical protein
MRRLDPRIHAASRQQRAKEYILGKIAVAKAHRKTRREAGWAY